MLLEDLLSDIGYKVVGPAGTVTRALELLALELVDGALLDVNLGGGERSYPVADQLLTLNIPFAFVTGYGNAGVDPKYADVAVLQKPFDFQCLCDFMGRVM